MRKNQLEPIIGAAYRNGVIDGIKRFAYWRDGVEYVGSCGKTLALAIEDFEREYSGATAQACDPDPLRAEESE